DRRRQHRAPGEHAVCTGRLPRRHRRALEIRPGQRRLSVGGGGELRAPSLAGFGGAYLAGRYTPYTRVDITEHCISAFLIAKRYGLASGERRSPHLPQ